MTGNINRNVFLGEAGVNKILACAVAVLSVGVLASCSSIQGSQQPVEPSGEALATEPSGEGGEAGGATEQSTATAQSEQQAQEASRKAEAADQRLEELELNDHGNEKIDVGETAQFIDLVSGDEFAKLTATTVQANFECTVPDAPESINGQYVALSFDINALEKMNDSGFTELYFSVHDFRVWDSEGEKVIDPVGNAESCIEADERIQTPILPGDEANGLVVLDVPEGSGSASYTLGGFEGTYGWEWSW
ncbi:hypothetical protein ACT17S_01615 [Glutamicibacter mysorens]